jgi:hypothetical protein
VTDCRCDIGDRGEGFARDFLQPAAVIKRTSAIEAYAQR